MYVAALDLCVRGSFGRVYVVDLDLDLDLLLIYIYIYIYVYIHFVNRCGDGRASSLPHVTNEASSLSCYTISRWPLVGARRANAHALCHLRPLEPCGHPATIA